MAKYWIGVVSRDHALKGKYEGIAQVCHGKQGPLTRMKKGDWIIYYSPKEIFGEKALCQKFTSIGKVADDEIYQYKMFEDFIPWRRNISYFSANEVAIEPLIDKLSFIKNKKQWGYMFRFGLFEITEEDFELVANEMGIDINEK